MENIVLKGTVEEQAKQLWETLREKHIDAEELKELVPMAGDFFRALADVLQREIESETSAYKDFHTSIQMIVEVCKAALADGNVSKEERLRILELLDKLSERMFQAQLDHNKHKRKFKQFLVGCGTFVAAAIVILTGKQDNGKILKS